MRTSSLVAASATALSLSACSSSTGYVPPGSPASFHVLEGSNQRAEPGRTLPDRLIAQLTDSAGNPVPGVPVQWAVTRGPGRLLTSDGRTDIGGKVTAEVALLDEVGDVQTRVRVVDDTLVSTFFVSYSTFPDDTTGRPAPVVEATVTIGDDFFSPITVTVHAGNAVKFVWAGIHAHNVLVTGTGHGAFPSRHDARVSGEAETTFAVPGEWTVWCTAHATGQVHSVVVNVR